MQHHQTYQRVSAWALIVLFTAFWSLKSGHILLMHHAGADSHPVCEAAHDQKSAHIHDKRWAVEDCTLCAFVVSVSEAFVLPALPEFVPVSSWTASPGFYIAPVFSKLACDVPMLRGPPVA